MRGLDLLELGNGFLFAARVPIRVALQCELPEGLADLVVVCVGGDSQVLVVVPRSISLGHVDGEACGGVKGVVAEGASSEVPTLVAVRQADANRLHSLVSRAFTVLAGGGEAERCR